MDRYLFMIDRLSTAVGKAFAWCILTLTLAVSYEVFVRYALGHPTQWAYDISYIMYGALFIMAGGSQPSRKRHGGAGPLPPAPPAARAPCAAVWCGPRVAAKARSAPPRWRSGRR